jgi:trk system potassium uptake protein TrkH
MGIIVFFIAVLPMLGVGGQQLFQAESTGPSKDKMTPKIRDTARNLWRLYVGFTLILVFFLILAGMSSFDAFNHAMTTMATGGFSTKNSGIAFYKSAIIDYLFIAFMFIGAINFGLHYRLIFKRDFSVLKDTEFKGYLLIIFLITVLIFQANFYNKIPLTTDNLEQNFRSSLFTVINIMSSTGYTHDNYLLWPAICHYLLVLIMLVGGMSGSTAGGIKVIRLVASIKLLFKELRQAIHPSAILSIKINNKTARDKTANAIWGFVFIYLFCLAFISGILVYTGLDLITATSATISAMSNIGPALGKLGPMDNYAFLSPTAKSALCLAMLLGRLEFMAILVLLLPEYWRK